MQATNILDLKAYALLMRVIGDSKYIVPHMREVIESLITRVANCTMSDVMFVYDKDESCIEVMGTLVRHLDIDGEETRVSSRQTWRINTKQKTLHLYTPNQWLLESSAWNVEDYYQDIAGCLILLNDINNR